MIRTIVHRVIEPEMVVREASAIEELAAEEDAIDSPNKVHAILRFMERLPREEVWVILLDVRSRCIGITRVSQGTASSSLIHPREVFGAAIRESAQAIIMAHNHPSGCIRPSPEDWAVTHRMIQAGRLLDINFVDHVIIGFEGVVSLRKEDRSAW